MSAALGSGKATYEKGSLKMMQNGFTFTLTNKRKVTLTKVKPLEVNGEKWPVAGLSFLTEAESHKADAITEHKPWKMPSGKIIVRVQGLIVGDARHDFRLPLTAKSGDLEVRFQDKMSAQ